QRGVAKDGDDVLVAAALVASGSDSESRREGGARVGGAVTVMLTFRSQRKTAQAIGGADGLKAVFPSGQQFVDVALMAHIPDEFVMGSGEDVMEGEGQLDDPEVGSEMA